MGNKFMLAIIEDTASVDDVYESIASTGVPEKSPDRVDGPQVVIDSILCTPGLGLTHLDFLRGV